MVQSYRSIFYALLIVPWILSPASAGATAIHLDYSGESSPPGAIPPDGAIWHELYPVHDNFREQTGYEDTDENGEVSAGDFISLDESRYSITWSGPTYFLSNLEKTYGSAFEPLGPGPFGGDPTGEEWLMVYPDFGNTHTITDWDDADGSGTLSVGDYVFWGDYSMVDAIGLDIVVEAAPTGTEEESWSKVKSLFR